MNAIKSNLGDTIRAKREAAGLTQTELGERVGAKQQTIEKIELGKINHSSYLLPISMELGIPLDMVSRSKKRVPADTVQETSAPIPASDLTTGLRDLPIYGTTDAGEGVMVLSDEPVDRGERPVALQHVKGAYGVIVSGDSMAPILRPGFVVLVNPNLPPRREELCVFRGESHGEFKSVIKELVSSTADTWRVRRYKPTEKEFNLKKKDWPECHVVVTVHRR